MFSYLTQCFTCFETKDKPNYEMKLNILINRDDEITENSLSFVASQELSKGKLSFEMNSSRKLSDDEMRSERSNAHFPRVNTLKSPSQRQILSTRKQLFEECF